MATDLEPQQASSPAPKHEQFVESQLARAVRRIHALDVGRTVLWLVAATLAFALAMAALDLTLSHREGAISTALQWAHLAAWGVYLAITITLAGLLAMRMFRRINPYYAARQMEDALPDAKNSVVNWLDLRDEKLPASIKTALGLRAARDLKNADPEQVGTGHSWWLAGFTVLLVAGLASLFVNSGPQQFASLMKRAFLPIERAAVVSPTEITQLEPAQPDAVVAPQQNITFRANISGLVPRVNTPQAPRLQYRYQDNDSWAKLPLEQDLDGNWAVTMPADLVQNGFFYKLSAGDAETAAHEVKVRSLPQAKRFDVKYHFQPYLRLPDMTAVTLSPKIKETFRGTEVTLAVHTNHPLREGAIELRPDGEPAQSIPGEIDANDPSIYRVKLLLEKSGSLRVLFTTAAGEENFDRSAHAFTVRGDLGPGVVLTNPAKDVSLPANGTLALQGAANDDFGIKNLTLRLKIVHNAEDQFLAPKPYRPGAALQFAEGSYPDYLDYKDFVALDQLKSVTGEAVPLAKGAVLAYWLEATDNCEFPSKKGNIGKSKVYRVTIADPEDEKKQQEQRQQAAQEQKRHEKEQDQDVKQQERDRQENRQRTPEERRKERDMREKEDRLQKEIKKEEKSQQGEGEGEPAPGQKTTMKDVNDLKNQLKQNGPESEEAAEKLEQAAENAKDQKVRQAAKKALKDNGLDKQPPAKDLKPEDIEKLKEQQKEGGPQGEAAERKLAKAADQASDPKTREAAKEALKDAVKNLTEKDIEKLTEKMKQKGPAADQAEDKLSRAAENAEDQKARDAAQKALQDAIKDLSEKDVKSLAEKLKQKGPRADRAEEKLSKAAEGAKDEKAREAAGQALTDAIKNMTEKDIKNLQEKLKEKGPLAEKAEDKLNRAAEEAKDPKAREAAEQAAKDLVKNLSEKDIAELKKKLNQPGPQADAAEKKLARASEAAKNEKTRDAAGQALKDAIKNLSEKDVKDLQEKLKQKGATADAAEKKLSQAAEGAKDEKARDAAGQALKDAIKNLTEKDVKDLQEKLRQKGASADAAEKKLSQAAEGAKDDKARAAAAEALKDAIKNLSEKDIKDLQKQLKAKGPEADRAKDKLNRAADEAADPKAREAAEQAARDLVKNLSPKDIDELKKKLGQPGPEGDAAEKKLARASEAAKDEKSREAAAQALKDAIKNLTEKDVKDLQEKLKQKGASGDAAEKKLSQAAEQAKDEKAREAAGQALRDAVKNLSEKDIKDLSDKLRQKGAGADAAEDKLQKAADSAQDKKVRDAAEQVLKSHENRPLTKKEEDELKEKVKPKGRDPQQPPSLDDVAKLTELMDKKGPLGDLAAKELENLAKRATDPQVKKAAEDALKSAPPRHPQKTADDVEALKQLLQHKGPLADFARSELQKLAEDPGNPKMQELAKQILRGSPPEPPKADNPDPLASKKAGSLQLEDLLKKVSDNPDIWKKAGFSEKEWLQYKKDVEAELARRHALGQTSPDDPLAKRGDPTKMSSVGPQLVTPSNPTVTPTQAGRGQPPPGYRELYERWTRPSAPPEKK